MTSDPAAHRAPDFDTMAGLYDDFTHVWDGIDRGAFAAWVGDRLDAGDPARGRALDLGCGAGRHLPVLAARHGTLLAADPSAAMLERARAHHPDLPAVTYRRAGVLDLDPDADGVFDAILSVAVLHHAGDPGRVLPAVRALLAPGGRLVVVDMVDPGTPDRPAWADPAWHLDRAFGDARAAYNLTGDAGQATAVLRQLLDPTWLAMATRDLPLTRAGFHATYADAFPGAAFTDDLHPLMCGVTWTAPTS